jgi:uncharacterized phage protein gp47/JayE
MATLPEYLSDQTEEAVRARLLGRLPSTTDTNQGSFTYDPLAAAAIEFALAAIWIQGALSRGFAQRTFGTWLDLRGEEHGVFRREAVTASGSVVVTGTPGVSIPASTEVSTPSTDTTPAQVFTTVEDAVIPSGGTVEIDVSAVEPGAAGNVPLGAIQLLAEPLAGITGLTNTGPTTGGLDIESDAEFLTRYLIKVRNPPAGGNIADYINWAFEVPGVGAVSVVPVRDGPGTVAVAILDGDKQVPSLDLVKAVQDHIAPPWEHSTEAEAMTVGGSGTSIDATQTDDTGSSVKMLYNAAGNGTIRHGTFQAALDRPGIWQARARVKVDTAAGTNDLWRIGVWNIDGAAWAKTTPGGPTDAVTTFKPTGLQTTFHDAVQEFYWDGDAVLELRIDRLTSETTRTVWVDRVVYRSTFSTDQGNALAPIGARVSVEAPTAVSINVGATLVLQAGYDHDSVVAAVETAIDDYLASLSFTTDNDVRYVRIGQAILDTAGVTDYTGLTVNAGTANVAVGAQQVAVAGTYTIT